MEAAIAPFKADLARYGRLSDLPVVDGSPYIKGKLIVITKSFKGSVREFDCESLAYRDTDFTSSWGFKPEARREEGFVDPLFFFLPKTLRASHPSELGTVIWLDWEGVRVAEYDFGISAYCCVVSVTIIDVTIPAIIATRRFKGGNPPDKIDSNTTRSLSVFGRSPLNEIEEFVKKLPGRSL